MVVRIRVGTTSGMGNFAQVSSVVSTPSAVIPAAAAFHSDSGVMRQSRAVLLDAQDGADGWVTHRENGITYIFDATKVMFSSGNGSEKMRVAKLDCSDEVVLDLYAGIGYFTLPLLVHARAQQ